MHTDVTTNTIPAEPVPQIPSRMPAARDSVHVLAAARFAAAVRCDVKLHALWRSNAREFGCETSVIVPETVPTVELQLHGPLLLRVCDDGSRINVMVHRSAAVDASPMIRSVWECIPAQSTSALLRDFKLLRASVSSAVPRALCRRLQIELDQILDTTPLAKPIFSVSMRRTPQTEALVEFCKRGEFDALWGANVYTDIEESGPIASVLRNLRTISVQVSYLDRKQWKNSDHFFRSAYATVTDTGEVLISSPLFDTHETCEDSMILASQERRHRRAVDFPVRATMKLSLDQLRYFVPDEMRVRAEAFAASQAATSDDEIECDFSLTIPRHALEVWFCAPLESGRAFTSVYTTLSKTLQQRMRDWLPAFWLQESPARRTRMAALTARLYHSSRTYIGVSPADLVPDWMSDHAAKRIWDSGLVRLRDALYQERLPAAKNAKLADLQAKRQLEVLSGWVWKNDALSGLIHKEARLVESFISFGATCRTLEKTGDITNAVRVYEAIMKALEKIRRVLRKFFMHIDYEVLLPLLFLETTNALNKVLKRDYMVTTCLTLRAPSGAVKKICNQAANFPRSAH